MLPGTVLRYSRKTLGSPSCGMSKTYRIPPIIWFREPFHQRAGSRKTGGQTVAGHVKRADMPGKSGSQIRHPSSPRRPFHLMRSDIPRLREFSRTISALPRECPEDNSVHMVATARVGDSHCPVIRWPNITRIGGKSVTAVSSSNHPVRYRSWSKLPGNRPPGAPSPSPRKSNIPIFSSSVG